MIAIYGNVLYGETGRTIVRSITSSFDVHYRIQIELVKPLAYPTLNGDRLVVGPDRRSNSKCEVWDNIQFAFRENYLLVVAHRYSVYTNKTIFETEKGQTP